MICLINFPKRQNKAVPFWKRADHDSYQMGLFFCAKSTWSKNISKGITRKPCSWPHKGPPTKCKRACTGPVTLQAPPLSLPSEEHIIIIIIIILMIIIEIIHWPTPVFKAKLKQSETVRMRFTKGSKRVECFVKRRGNTCQVDLGAAPSGERLLVRMGGSFNGDNCTARYGGRPGATRPATYSLPAKEALEWWGQRWSGQRSVEDDTEHGASAEG